MRTETLWCSQHRGSAIGGGTLRMTGPALDAESSNTILALERLTAWRGVVLSPHCTRAYVSAWLREGFSESSIHTETYGMSKRYPGIIGKHPWGQRFSKLQAPGRFRKQIVMPEAHAWRFWCNGPECGLSPGTLKVSPCDIDMQPELNIWPGGFQHWLYFKVTWEDFWVHPQRFPSSLSGTWYLKTLQGWESLQQVLVAAHTRARNRTHGRFCGWAVRRRSRLYRMGRA